VGSESTACLVFSILLLTAELCTIQAFSASSASSPSSQPAPGMSSTASGLEGLADFIASNYEGMGKSAADVLPELRRKGIVASGSGYSIQGRKLQMSAPDVAELLRLQVGRSFCH